MRVGGHVSLLSVSTLLYTHVVKERKDDLDFGAQVRHSRSHI
jgi:hypothetical protein